MKVMPKGDAPAMPLTEQSEEQDEFQYPLMTLHSNVCSNRKYNFVETAQSQQSLRSRLFSPNLLSRQSQVIYEEFLHQAPKKQEPVILKSTKVTPDLHKKLNDEYISLKQRKLQLQEQHQQDQLSKCTFRPQIGLKSRKIGTPTTSNLTSPRYMSPKNIYQEQPQPKPIGRPYVSEASKKLLLAKQHNEDGITIGINNFNQSQNKENVFDRLCSPKASKQFQPTSTITSACQSRKASPEGVEIITNRLYDDAFQPRKIKSPPKTNYPNPITPQARLNAEKYQIHHFVKEFYHSITQARLWTLEHWEQESQNLKFKFEVESDLCLMTVNEVAYSMDIMGFLPFSTYSLEDPKCPIIHLFKMLQCPKGFELILSRNLLQFLLAMQGIGVDYAQVPSYTNNYNIAFPIKMTNSVFGFEGGNIMIGNVEQVQQQFKDYYINYLTYKKSEQPKPVEQVKFKASPKTAQLANNFRERVQSQFMESNSMDLNDFKSIYQKKKNKLSEQVKSEHYQECTFKPQINNNVIGTAKYTHTNRREYPQVETEKPSFTPDISRSQSTHTMKGTTVDSSKIVQRMVKARVEKQLNDLIIHSGTCNSKKRRAFEQRLYQDEIQRINKKQPLLYVDVSLDCNQCRRITIYQDDTAEELAIKFIGDNNLDPKMKNSLILLIEEQMNTLK